VRSVMSDAGTALLGIGVGSGRSRAVEAAQAAMTSPLLESARIDGSRGVVINISGGKDMTSASEVIYDVVDPDANIIVGAVVDERLEGEIHVTVIATGFESGAPYRHERPALSFNDANLLGELGGGAEPSAPPHREGRGAMIPPFLLNRQRRESADS
jgi:cell division protein FtsZ